MEPRASALPWRRCIHLTLLLLHLSLPGGAASCRILQCNSDFVAATLNLGSVEGSLDPCLYEQTPDGPEFLHCAVFGDPHVRTFSDDFQTCQVRGAWPLVDNDFLFIQATSTPCEGGGRSTAITKISIIFKSWRQCVDQQLYQAELDNVPAAFADGSVWSGERGGGQRGGGRPSLTVSSRLPGRHAEIRAEHIDSLLVVRQSGRSLGVSLRSPRGVAFAFGPDQDLQLCVGGCPSSQRLAAPRPPHPVPPATARAHCGELLPVRDVYFHACVFDLLSGGDLNSSAAAAVGALQDAAAMMPNPWRLHLLRGAVTHTPPPTLMLLLLGMLGTLSTTLGHM
ncbi:Hemojuvelin [Dissostichus eleginoides]|uniref:Hemojuvelin n=1 Tax=Dissostichus eleginoides TaxID=100907 RepID=A0AAD9C6H6_DISEL|nr:Hemojuvelin [Dissostichus eleginoides]